MEANGSLKPEFETDEIRSYFISRLYIHKGFLDEPKKEPNRSRKGAEKEPKRSRKKELKENK